MLSHLRIGARMLVIIACVVAGFVITYAITMMLQSQTLLADRQALLESLIESAHGIATHYLEQSQTGAMTEADAQAAALEDIRAMRYGDGDYFFVNDEDAIMLMHPNRDLEGQDLSGLTDADGVRPIAELAEAGRDGGSGFVRYRWPRAGSDEPLPKLSFARGVEAWDWVIGTGVYIDDIDAVFMEVATELGAVMLITLVVVGGVAFVIARTITRPLSTITGCMQRLAEGDLNVDAPYDRERNEIGDLARSFRVFRDNAQRMEEMRTQQEEAERRAAEERRETLLDMAASLEASVMDVVGAVSSASDEMHQTAGTMAELARETSGKAEAVADGSQEASANVQTVASATEELNASIGEIGRQAAKSADIAATAVTQADTTNQEMASLTEAAEKIGEVVQLITAIAEQTNLLALNATIEAARAGEAGKGFAVVASEVKNLANQTAKATEDISRQINAVQSVTGRAAEAMDRISSVIGEMNEIAAGIAAAVEEQGAATREISSNVDKTAEGASAVSQNIHAVSEASQETGGAAQAVLAVAGDLSRHSDTLRDEVAAFLNQVRTSA